MAAMKMVFFGSTYGLARHVPKSLRRWGRMQHVANCCLLSLKTSSLVHVVLHTTYGRAKYECHHAVLRTRSASPMTTSEIVYSIQEGRDGREDLRTFEERC